MKVTNTTEKDITVKLTGVTYTVGADSTISGVPAADAKYWKERLHNFLILTDEDVTVEVKEEKEEVVEEVKEEVAEEEVVEETPKATKKTTKKVTKK